MPKPLPVIRRMYAPALIPQFLAIAALTVIIGKAAPTLPRNDHGLIGASVYLVACRIMRMIYCRHHAAGIRAYKMGRFEDSIDEHRASCELFSRHPLLDRMRWMVFGSASQNPYRTIARCNMAFSEILVGRTDSAINHYEEALKLTPDCPNAIIGLRGIRERDMKLTEQA